MKKLSLFISGLVITLILLEISLRLAGFIYKSYRTNERIIAKEDKNIIKILCLGDSITFGLGAERGYDYPAQLERILNGSHPQKNYIVYNQGCPGFNSSQVLRHLEDNIQKYKPGIITLLVGTNNRFNLADSNYYLFESGINGRIKIFSLKLDALLMRMRTYKLLKIALLRLGDTAKQKISANIKDNKEVKYVNSKNLDTSVKLNHNYKKDLDLANEYYGQRKFGMAIEQLGKVLAQDSSNQSALILLGKVYIELEKYDLALAKLKRAVLNSPEDAWAHHALGILYYKQGRNNPLIKDENFGLAIKELEKSISCANNPKDKIWAYYYLSEVFFEQGKADLATGAIENAVKYDPDNESLRKQLRVVSKNPNETPEEAKVFDKLLYYDLDCIARIARDHGIKLILLSHPRVANRNEIRKQIADKYNIPFIDISSIFTELLAKYNYKDLFSDDASHPNANGYRVIAESIYGVINSIKFENSLR